MSIVGVGVIFVVSASIIITGREGSRLVLSCVRRGVFLGVLLLVVSG